MRQTGRLRRRTGRKEDAVRPHLELEEAVDFVRGLLPAAARTRITRHLDEPCARCRSTVAWAAQVAATARETTEVPEPVLRRAIAAFAGRPASEPSWGRRLLAALVFDSAAAPALAGVRSTQGGSRQAVFRAGEYLVDLKVDFDRSRRLISLVGQVGAEDTGAAVPAFGRVQLSRKRSVVAEAGVSEFGEFQFECRPETDLHLRIAVEAGARHIDVPLAALMQFS